MSEATSIDMFEAIGVHARLQWTRMRRRRIWWVAAALLALPPLLAALLVAFGHFGRGLFDDLCKVHYFALPFLPAVLASSIVAEELDQKTFTYLFARPAPRSSLVFGKYLAVVVPLIGGFALSLTLTWLVAMLRYPDDMGPGLSHLLATIGAAALGTLAYAGVAAMFGAWFVGAPFIATLIFILPIEILLGGLAPFVLNLVSVSWHLRNLAGLPTPTPSPLEEVPLVASLIVPLVYTGLGLLAASTSVTGAQYHARE